MAASSSFGLKDLLSPQPDSNSMPFTKPMKPLVSFTTSLVVEHDQNHEKVYLESNASSSTLRSFSSPSLQFSMSVPSDKDMSLNLVENHGKEKEEFESKKDNGSYLERNIGREMEEKKNKQVTNRKCFPPPISCLRKVKVGKPFRYLRYDKESESYVVEEIKIRNGSLFHASREDGRLKLSMSFQDEEEESQES